MKRKIQFMALIPFYALIIAAGIRAGGSTHDNCAECNRAIGKQIKTVISEENGEKTYVVQDSVRRTSLPETLFLRRHVLVRSEK